MSGRLRFKVLDSPLSGSVLCDEDRASGEALTTGTRCLLVADALSSGLTCSRDGLGRPESTDEVCLCCWHFEQWNGVFLSECEHLE